LVENQRAIDVSGYAVLLGAKVHRGLPVTRHAGTFP
jgi:hypothetical protein